MEKIQKFDISRFLTFDKFKEEARKYVPTIAHDMDYIDYSNTDILEYKDQYVLNVFDDLPNDFVDKLRKKYLEWSFDLGDLDDYLNRDEEGKQDYENDVINGDEIFHTAFFNEEFLPIIEEYNKITEEDLEEAIRKQIKESEESVAIVDLYYDINEAIVKVNKPDDDFIKINAYLSADAVNDVTIEDISINEFNINFRYTIKPIADIIDKKCVVSASYSFDCSSYDGRERNYEFWNRNRDIFIEPSYLNDLVSISKIELPAYKESFTKKYYLATFSETVVLNWLNTEACIFDDLDFKKEDIIKSIVDVIV